ncbi:MAG TPA: methylglyoxal synthase [Ktedonobacteraceae bacterium]|nr:methylglyoxal synthase [Ktedonobacteraceae bacterium]
MNTRKNIALVAHDEKKQDLLEWAKFNKDLLLQHELYATGTTGKLLEEILGVEIHKLQSGPLGGDQQLGAMIVGGEIDLLVFFWDPLTTQAHTSDVQALLRIAVVWNIPVACDRAAADFMITSPLLTGTYQRFLPDYQGYTERMARAQMEEEVSAAAEHSPA